MVKDENVCNAETLAQEAVRIGVSREQMRRIRWKRESATESKSHNWTLAEIAILEEKYPHHGNAFAAKFLGLPISIVRDKSVYMRLKLLPREQRLCIECGKNYLEPAMRGNKCRSCRLKSKNTQRTLRSKESASKFRELANSSKYRSKLNNLEYNLSSEFLQELFIKQDGKCAYTGHEMNIERPWAGSNKRDEYATTVDRVDPDKGYIRDNVALVCLWVNVAKNRFTLEEFVKNCKMVVDYKFSVK